ncbi:MAG: HD domain-containing protein [Lachnospiraceae bacterium]|nr:HD domain-containing protein [Lachnospiraceae bacterium]
MSKSIRKAEAEEIFHSRQAYHGGSWAAHSQNTALAAERIADKIQLDSELAYCMGLLHDIGRSFTDGQFRHITCGFAYMNTIGHPDIADICLSHSFAVQDIYSYVGNMDISKEEQKRFQELLQKRKYTEYDKLIQLCDAVAVDTGFVLPEQRFVGLSFRYGFNAFTIQKWKAVLRIKEEINAKLRQDVNVFLNQ